MNWKLDENDPYTWQVEGAPFGVEKIDRAHYVPFRLWGSSRLYVMDRENRNENLYFTSRRDAFAYVEGAVKSYLSTIIA